MLKVPAAARSAALGGAFSMVPGNAESMWYNPAGIAGINGGELGFSHSAWIEGASNEFAFGAFGGGRFALGAYGQYSALQDVARDAFGREAGAFTNSGQVGGLALAGRMGFMRLGLGAKMLGQSVAGRSDLGYAGDAGVIASVMDGRLMISLSALNMGAAPNLGAGNSNARLPLNFRAGLGLMRMAGFKVLGEYRRWNESGQDSLAGGAEFMLAFDRAELAWRAGYESGLAEGGVAGASAGVGVGYAGLRIDYSYQMLGELGSGQRLSLDWRYKNSPAQARPAGLKSAVEKSGQDPDAARLRLAKGEYDAGRYRVAAEIFSKLAEENPVNFGRQSAAGMSYLKAGDKALALKFLKRAKELKPEREDLLHWIKIAEEP